MLSQTRIYTIFWKRTYDWNCYEFPQKTDLAYENWKILDLSVQKTCNREWKLFECLMLLQTQPLEKIMREYARKMAVRFEQLTFSFDGVTLSPRQTPGDVDLEDEECIDVTGLWSRDRLIRQLHCSSMCETPPGSELSTRWQWCTTIYRIFRVVHTDREG